MSWWHAHPEKIERRAVYTFTCQTCGIGFEAYGNNHRKYCSRACYQKAVSYTHLVASGFGAALDLSSNTSIRNTITQNVDEAIAGIEIGGVNLIRDSETYTLAAEGADTYWIAADELEPGMTYTLSVREVVLSAGQAAGCLLYTSRCV